MELRVQKRKIQGVLLSGLVVSLLVAAGTTFKYVISGGKHPLRLLNFVASGVFGQAAFQGEVATQMAVLGGVLHVTVSIVWAILFFVLCSRIAILSKDWRLTGIGYGILIWVGMAFVVLPLSNTPPIPFEITNAAIDILLVTVCAGFPISFVAHKYGLLHRDVSIAQPTQEGSDTRDRV